MTVRIYQMIIIVLSVMLFSVWQVYAGNPAGPGTSPDSTSSYTLNDIYARLDAGTAGTESTFTEPSVAPGTSTTHTLNEIMAKAPTVDDTDGGTAADMASGQTFWALTSGEWGLQTGTAPPAVVPKTGQTTCYDGNNGSEITCSTTGQDGDHQAGVAWPNPRFTDNNDGTVTDELTGLIWLKDANCFGQKNWTTALSNANGLASGTCGLNDGSSAGDWRLSNRFELESLLDLEYSHPALSNTAGTEKWQANDPFTNVQSAYYWSSSTYVNTPGRGWLVALGDGNLGTEYKLNVSYVWPVRGGQ